MAHNESTIVAEVEQAAHDWAAAIQSRDTAVLERLLAEEYVLQAPGIGRMPRAAWLAALHMYDIVSFAFDDVRIHVYGETAVMQSRYRQQATFRGDDRSGELLVTDVWVRRTGQWQVVARHTSFVTPNA